jgi:hypothetical protein
MKRSTQVTLVLMTVAMGAGAYALSSPSGCRQSGPGTDPSQQSCQSSHGGHGFHFGGSGGGTSGTPAPAADTTSRGGFGWFGRAFSAVG